MWKTLGPQRDFQFSSLLLLWCLRDRSPFCRLLQPHDQRATATVPFSGPARPADSPNPLVLAQPPSLSPPSAAPLLWRAHLFWNHLTLSFWGFYICSCFLFKKTLHIKRASGITQNRNVSFCVILYFKRQISGRKAPVEVKMLERTLCQWSELSLYRRKHGRIFVWPGVGEGLLKQNFESTNSKTK